MTEYPPQYPDQNPASGSPPAEPGPAVPEQRDQSSAPSDQTWYSTNEPPTTIAPVPPTPPPPAYPASPAYGQATPYPATPAPASPAAYPATPGYPVDPYAVPADPYPTTPYPTTPYPPAPAPAGYNPYPASPAYGQTSVPPYGQPQAMQPVALVVAPPSSGAATASLVLGIIGLVLGWCVCGIPSLLAIIFGHIGLKQTRNNQMSGHGNAVAGLVMGYILIVPTIIATVLFLGYLGVFGAAAATSGSGY